MGTTEYVTDVGILHKLLTSAEIEVSGILPINQETLCVKWHFKNEAVLPSALTNVVVAAFTTVQARLKLFECLHTLRQRRVVDILQNARRARQSELEISARYAAPAK